MRWPRPRISLASLMGVVLVAAIGIAALRNADELWAGLMLALALFALGVAILAAVFRRESRRAFALGFALFLGGYLTLTFGPWFSDQVEPKLPTSKLLAYGFSKLNPKARNAGWEEAYAVFLAYADSGNRSSQETAIGASTPALRRSDLFARYHYLRATDIAARLFGSPDDAAHFSEVGHCLFALVLGLVGGWIARRFHDREPTRSADRSALNLAAEPAP